MHCVIVCIHGNKTLFKSALSMFFSKTYLSQCPMGENAVSVMWSNMFGKNCLENLLPGDEQCLFGILRALKSPIKKIPV